MGSSLLLMTTSSCLLREFDIGSSTLFLRELKIAMGSPSRRACVILLFLKPQVCI